MYKYNRFLFFCLPPIQKKNPNVAQYFIKENPGTPRPLKITLGLKNLIIVKIFETYIKDIKLIKMVSVYSKFVFNIILDLL